MSVVSLMIMSPLCVFAGATIGSVLGGALGAIFGGLVGDLVSLAIYVYFSVKNTHRHNKD